LIVVWFMVRYLERCIMQDWGGELI
jgi:hypothetical protein